MCFIFFPPKATTTLSTNDIVINKLTQILSYLRQGKRDAKKLKKKEKGMLMSECHKCYVFFLLFFLICNSDTPSHTQSECLKTYKAVTLKMSSLPVCSLVSL